MQTTGNMTPKTVLQLIAAAEFKHTTRPQNNQLFGLMGLLNEKHKLRN